VLIGTRDAVASARELLGNGLSRSA
jgi:hypothetical protein